MGARHHLREYEGVDQQQQEWIEEGPEKAEDRTAVAGFQITDDQRLDQPAISKQRCEISKHLSGFPPGAVAACAAWRAARVRNRSRAAAAPSSFQRASCPLRRVPGRDPLLSRKPARAPRPTPAAPRRSRSTPSG